MMRFYMFIAAVFSVACIGTGSAAQELSPRQFRDQIRVALLSERAGLCVKDVDDYTLNFGKTAAECESFLNIDNTYTDYRANPSKKDALIQRLTRIGLSVLDKLDQTNDIDVGRNLVVLLRPFNYGSQGQGVALSRPFAGDLAAFLMLDAGDHYESVANERLEKAKLSDPEAWGFAESNIRRLLGPLETVTKDGYTIVAASSGLALSRLWLPEACDTRRPATVVLAAGRDAYLTVEVRNTAGLKALGEAAKQMINENASMSQTLIACLNGKWVGFTPN